MMLETIVPFLWSTLKLVVDRVRNRMVQGLSAHRAQVGGPDRCRAG
jgi:hypothetical protein